MNREQVVCADCLEHMKTMPENSVDSIVTDPPYGLSFMNKEWDSFGTDTRQPGDEHYWVPDNPYGRSKARYGWNQDKSKLAASNRAFQESMTYVFEEALRVAKPGAHLLCFGGTRTFHRMACAIEDAGWEIRDCIMWVYGCLDEETEVLVDGEFVPYNKAKKGRLALGYDIGTGNFSWQRIEGTMLACNADFIVCDVVDGGKEMTKQKMNLLRDYLPDIEGDLNEVVVALMGHTFAEVE